MTTLLILFLTVELSLAALAYRREWLAGARIRSTGRIARGLS